MKILHLVEASFAGVGRHALDLAEGQTALGHEVTILWSPVRAEPAWIARLKSLARVREAELPISRSPGLSDAKAVGLLADYIRANGPFDILHGHSSKGGALVRLLPRKLGGLRIYTPNAFRTQDPSLAASGMLAFGLMERVLGWWADRIIAVSSQEVEHAQAQLGIPARKLALVPNGADLADRGSREEARAFMGLNDGEIAIGFIGRLSPQKNPERFVDSMRLAHAQCPQLRGILVGDGELRTRCEALACDAPVRFLGWQDGPALIKGFDVFCMTSIYEGFPYTLLEAIHAGIPIVTADIGGAREAVIDGETGRILPLDASPEEFAKVLAELGRDPETRKRWSAANLAMAHLYTQKKMVERTLTVYEEAIGEGRGR